jgi:PleD family two-component response regulator
VVLADFWMPGMNGLEMTDLIRRWDENNDRYTGIVLLTAEDTASSIVVAFDRGVDDFVSKSANQFELSARVYGVGRTAFKQNKLRERMRLLSAQLVQVKQSSLQDTQTGLPNRAQFEMRIESLIEHCNARGGSLGVALIRVRSSEGELRPGTLKTIANSLQLSLRPMDMVSRFKANTFGVSVHYTDTRPFNPDLFQRLVDSVRRHTSQTSDQGAQLNIAVGVWHSSEFDPAPTFDEVIDAAHQAMQDVKPA